MTIIRNKKVSKELEPAYIHELTGDFKSWYSSRIYYCIGSLDNYRPSPETPLAPRILLPQALFIPPSLRSSIFIYLIDLCLGFLPGLLVLLGPFDLTSSICKLQTVNNDSNE